MKYLVLLGDGMADFPVPELDDRTPLAASETPGMDRAVCEGISGLFCPIPDSLPAGSDVGNLSIFGYNPELCFTGRAPLEAVNQGIPLGEDDIAFRCNLVTLRDGKMVDFTADHISSEEAAKLIAALNDRLSGEDIEFFAGVSYRHICIVGGHLGRDEGLIGLKCTPPHDIIDKEYNIYLPKGVSSSLVLNLMRASRDVLETHPVNVARREAGKGPATSIWLWGQGRAPNMESYAERFGISGAVISAVDLVNGIGRSAGFEVIRVPGATGYLDTDYEGKVSAALGALERVDFVYLHVEAPDEAAHEGDAELKVRAIEDFDARVVSPCLAWAAERGDCRILIAPDHVTALSTRTHAGGPVPFALVGPGIVPNGLSCFSEEEAARAGVLYRAGHELVPAMLSEEEIVFPRVQ